MNIPQFAGPIRRTSEENIRPERIGSDLINSASVAEIGVQIRFRIGFTAAVNGGFFCTGQIDIRLRTKEIETETSCLTEIHAFVLTFFLSRIVLAFQIHEILVLKTLFHAPFHHSTVTRNRDQTFSAFLGFSDPLDFPNAVGMLAFGILVIIGQNRLVSRLTDIPNGHHTIISTTGNQIRVILRELTRSDAIRILNDTFRERRVLQGPEGQKSFVFRGEIKLAIGTRQKVMIDRVPIGRRHGLIVSQITLELEQLF